MSSVFIRDGDCVSTEVTVNPGRRVDVRCWCPVTDTPVCTDRLDIVSAQARKRLVNSLRDEYQEEAAAQLASLADEVVSYRQQSASPLPQATTPAPTPEDRAADWEACQSIGTHPRILDLFAESLRRCGVVGEDRAAKIIFLATVSRDLERPVSVAVKGPSSGGKSFTVQRTLDHFDASAYFARTSLSPLALAYTDETFSHRMLVVYEAAGIGGDMGSYLIRSLLSEGRLCHETVQKTNQGFEPLVIEKEGPTGLIVTTTAVSLHPENETRMLSVTVTDTQAQTRAVLTALAEGPGEEVDLEPWRAFCRWLGGAEHRVVIPYARRLMDLIPPVAVRLRRDGRTLLNLISAHALLHQASRERTADGHVMATPEDYAVVRELVSDLVAEGVGATVPATVRATVAAVRALEPAETGVTVVRIGKYLQLDRSAALRRVQKAIAEGYLRNLETGRGKPARVILGDPIPDELVLLPTPADVSGCTVACESGGETSTELFPGRPFGFSDEEWAERLAIKDEGGAVEKQAA